MISLLNFQSPNQAYVDKLGDSQLIEFKWSAIPVFILP